MKITDSYKYKVRLFFSKLNINSETKKYQIKTKWKNLVGNTFWKREMKEVYDTLIGLRTFQDDGKLKVFWFTLLYLFLFLLLLYSNLFYRNDWRSSGRIPSRGLHFFRHFLIQGAVKIRSRHQGACGRVIGPAADNISTGNIYFF
jgi:hypothetical protein